MMKFGEKLLKELTRKFLKIFWRNLCDTCENVKRVIILQEFKEISWDILKKLKQLLKKFCVNFGQVKFRGNLKAIL